MIKRFVRGSGLVQRGQAWTKSLLNREKGLASINSKSLSLRSELRLNSAMRVLSAADDIDVLISVIKACDDITIANPLFRTAIIIKTRVVGVNQLVREAVCQKAVIKALKALHGGDDELRVSQLEIIEAISIHFELISKSPVGNDVVDYFFDSQTDFSNTLSVIRSSSALTNQLLYSVILERYQNLKASPLLRRRFIAYVIGFWHQHSRPIGSFESELLSQSWAEKKLDLREVSLISQNGALLSKLDSHSTYTELLSGCAENNINYKLVQANLSLSGGMQDWLSFTEDFFAYFGLSGMADSDEPLFSTLEFKRSVNDAEQKSEKVTIAMPAFNAEGTIEASIRSILNQSHSNIELIVVDDCSSDATAEVAHRLSEQDHRIKVLRNEVNVGPYVCRNIALHIGTGKYFTVNDADDLSHPNRVEDHLSILKNTPAYAVESQLVRITEDLKYISDSQAIFVRKNASSLFFDREALIDEFGCWQSVRYGADTELAERILSSGKRIVCSPKPYMLARLSEENLSVRKGNVIRGTTGSRKAYSLAFRSFHKAVVAENEVEKKFKYGFSMSDQFPVPVSMQLSSKDLTSISKHYGVEI